MSAFVTAAVVLMLLVFAAAFTIARVEDATVARITAQAPRVKTWSGAILIVVGGWFLVLAIFADRFTGIFPV